MVSLHRKVIKYLRDEGARNVRIEHGGKHPRCYFNWGGQEGFCVLPSSPGDAYRGERNVISGLRRLLRESGAAGCLASGGWRR
jgi:hypothetical protein